VICGDAARPRPGFRGASKAGPFGIMIFDVSTAWCRAPTC